MALFGSKKNTKKAAAPKETQNKKEIVPVESRAASTQDLSHIIKRLRITEKASMKAEQNVYAFDVATTATKQTIARAVKELYNVTPLKIAVVTIPAKQVIVRNKRGIKQGGKKAYVYLKKGDAIEFV